MQTIYTSGPQLTPIIPPVSGLLDFNGRPIVLDRDIIVTRLRWMKGSHLVSDQSERAKIVGIGDGGLPGKPVVKIRMHGSTYVQTSGPEDIEIHDFDEYEWLAAETDIATEMCNPDYRFGKWQHFQQRGADLTKTLFGGFWFEHFQRATMSRYLARINYEEKKA